MVVRRLPIALVAVAFAAVALAPAAQAQVPDPLFKTFHHELFLAQLHIAAGDVNNDGYDDLAARGQPGFQLYLGNGDGTFADAITLTGTGGNDHKFADFDSDGTLDLVWSGGPNVFVRLGNGDATFGKVETYETVNDSGAIAVADLDGDDILDLAVGNQEQLRVSVLLGVGDGSFGPKQNYGPTGERPDAVAVGDLNGDTFPDLVFANFYDDFLSILFNDGTGHYFGGSTSLTTLEGPESVAAADIDEDGLLDLVVGASGYVQLFVGDGLGNFAAPTNVAVGPASPALVVTDFDEDDHLDVAIGAGLSTATILLGHGDGTFDTPYAVGTANAPYDLVAGDWNKDGEVDLAGVIFAGDGIDILWGRGDGQFGPMHRTGGLPESVELADMNGDGILDAITVDTGDDTISVLPGLGDGWFGLHTAHAVGLEDPTTLVVADFDGDSNLDVATARSTFGTGQISVLLGGGDLTFAAPVLSTSINAIIGMAPGDFDKDGDLDLAVTRDSGNIVYVFPGNGDGTFGPSDGYDGWLGPKGITVGDFDGDTWLDLAAATDTGPGTVQVFLNRGNGSFNPRIESPANNFSHRVANADLDGDGNLDLVTSGPFGGMAVLLGNGDGSFGVHTPLVANNNPLGVEIGDVDNDGVLDIVAAHQHLFFDEGSVGVHVGNGDGTFQPLLSFSTAGDTPDVALGDVDGDGVLDVASLQRTVWSVTIMRSERGPWDDLGNMLAGTNGFPHQNGEGTLVGGEPFAFTLSDALPGGSAFHIVGLTAINAGFKGGVMVPNPDLINGPLPIDGDGRLVLAGPWVPGVPSGFQLWLQFWFADAGGPVGFAATNAVRTTMP